jgi:PhnB protein
MGDAPCHALGHPSSFPRGTARREAANRTCGCDHPPMVSPVPEHLHTVTPRLVVRDGAVAIDFYRRAFGAEEIGERFTGPDKELIHAELRIGDSVVMISEDDIEPAGAIMATYWENVDPVWERALAAGAEVIFPIDDHFYGDRAGRLRDPFGHQWMLAQHIEDVSREEMDRRAAEQFGSSG